jgi:hypothetical protein
MIVIGYCLLQRRQVFWGEPTRSSLLRHLKRGRTKLGIKITGVGNEVDIASMNPTLVKGARSLMSVLCAAMAMTLGCTFAGGANG